MFATGALVMVEEVFSHTNYYSCYSTSYFTEFLKGDTFQQTLHAKNTFTLHSTLTIMLHNTPSFTAVQYSHYVIMAFHMFNYLVLMLKVFLSRHQSCETGVAVVLQRALLL